MQGCARRVERRRFPGARCLSAGLDELQGFLRKLMFSRSYLFGASFDETPAVSRLNRSREDGRRATDQRREAAHEVATFGAQSAEGK